MSVSTVSRRRFIALAGATSVGMSFGITGRAGAAAQLRLTHPADTSHPLHVATEKMAERVAERTGGEVKITLFPNNALGSPVETAQQTRLGAIDMILLNPANIEALSKTIGVINIPYQFDGYEHAHRTLDDDRARLDRAAARRPRASPGSRTSSGASGRCRTAAGRSNGRRTSRA